MDKDIINIHEAIKSGAEELKRNVVVFQPCPCCESRKIIKDGTRKTEMGKKQRWLCNECGKRFVIEPIKRIKGNVDIVTLVMDLFFKGCSLRKIQDTVKQFCGLKVHHETVRRWINKYMEKIRNFTEKLKPEFGDKWHLDEQKVLTKRDEYVWCWNLIDAESRFLIANNITKTRYVADARAVLKKAKMVTDKRPEEIVTDGLKAYHKGVKKEYPRLATDPVLGYKTHLKHTMVKTVEDKPGNNLVERFHNTYRERDKVMRGLQNEETAEEFSDNYRTYYNFVRKHQGIGMLTPAQKAGIKETSDLKELLIRSLSAEARQPKGDSR